MSAKSGFTLVELLVVIAIMAITGVFALSNYRSFGEDRNLKNAVLDIQSLLRQAQANATSNVVCSSNWQVSFASSKLVYLKCSAAIVKELKLDQNSSNIAIKTVSGTSCMSGTPFALDFTPLSGKINFSGYTSCAQLTVTLTNGKTDKSLIIEQGGRIYEQ